MFERDKNGELNVDEWASFLDTAKKLSAPHGLLAIRTDGRRDVTASHVVWRENRAIPEVPSPLVLDGRLYLVRNGGILSCLDTAGKVVYRGRVGAP